MNDTPKLCECGCGTPTLITRRGRKPRRFIDGHHNRRPTQERFWEKVSVAGPNECWQWRGSVTAGGYGNFKFAGSNEYAHRAAYMLSVGEIPEGLHIDHLCRNRLCVNPAHLEPVTQRENNARNETRSCPGCRRFVPAPWDYCFHCCSPVLAVRTMG